jgi:hypothetical protein
MCRYVCSSLGLQCVEPFLVQAEGLNVPQGGDCFSEHTVLRLVNCFSRVGILLRITPDYGKGSSFQNLMFGKNLRPGAVSKVIVLFNLKKAPHFDDNSVFYFPSSV